MNGLRRLIDDITHPFCPAMFSHDRAPVRAGNVQLASMETELPSCLDMLIKLPEGNVTLPPPYAGTWLEEFLAICCAFEDQVLPEWRDSHYLYLTFDQRMLVPGKSHRNAGWHFDGMQGARYPLKIDACHQYVVSSRMPTEYWTKGVDATGLDENRHNWFTELGGQAEASDDDGLLHGIPGDIMLMSAYQLHRSPVYDAPVPERRTFVRLDVSLKKQDRLGNTLNPSLPAPFKFHRRSLPVGLNHSINDSGWEGGRKLAASA